MQTFNKKYWYIIVTVVIIFSIIGYIYDFKNKEYKVPVCHIKLTTQVDSIQIRKDITVAYIKKINPYLESKWVDSLSSVISKTSFQFDDELFPIVLAIFHTESDFIDNQIGTTDDIGLGQLTKWVTLEYNLIKAKDSTLIKRDRHKVEDNIWLTFWYLDFIKGRYGNDNINQMIVYYNGGNKQRMNFINNRKMVKTTSNYLKKVKRRTKFVNKTIKDII